MSLAGERSALEPPISLFDHARQALRSHPNGPLPNGGRPFPDNYEHRHVVPSVRATALTAALRAFLDDPGASADDLHEACTRLAVTALDVPRVVEDLALDPSPRLHDTARQLVEKGTDRRAVLVGLGLLRGNAEPRDIPLIRTIGLLCFADDLAVRALATIPDAAPDLIWLAERSRGRARETAVRELLTHTDQAVRAWVRSTPADLLAGGLARPIAEAQSLPDLLAPPNVDDLSWDQVGQILHAMNSTQYYHSEIARYADAVSAYGRWTALAATRTPILARAALLTSVATDLSSGPAAPVVGKFRRGLIEEIASVLAMPSWSEIVYSPDPVEARRAAWIRDQTARNALPAQSFAVRVAVPDQVPDGFPEVEARILIDGVPVVATAFDKGPADDPERLIHSGLLRATVEPREVRLAEAYCTEGCCGGLYVTIVREGPEVIWRNWRSSTPGDPPPDVRFDAADYDREVARAEQDHSWEWPARTVARLVADQLRADPTILGRWQCSLGWCTAWLKDFDTARITFTYPSGETPSDGRIAQFGLVVDIDDRNPQAVADEIIASMHEVDPRSTAGLIGGSKDLLDPLGLTVRRPDRW